MSTSVPICVEAACLDYRLPHHQASSLKELAVRAVQRKIGYDTLRALNEVSFSVERGEVLGVIGPNGAGKSSLMKLIARILPPTAGRIRVRGRVSAMIELGAGFHSEQTARENILLYGTLLGRDVREMKRRCGPIMEWAGLSEFLDVPVRAFSSGMVARLGFSVAVDVKPDVLLVDEILSVGDEVFQRKSAERMSELIVGGTAVVLVSHNMRQIMEKAHRVIWLDRGNVQQMGEPGEVVSAYTHASDVASVAQPN